MIDPARVESACWDTIQKWCQEGGQDLHTDYRTMRFSVELDDDDGSHIPTYCAFKGETVICGFNSDTRLQALVLAANWCQEQLVKP